MFFISIVWYNFWWGNILYIPKNMYTRLNYIRKDRVFLHIFHTNLYNSMNEKNMFSFDFVCMCWNILHKIPPCAHTAPLSSCTNLHTKMLPHIHLHKFHNTPLHPRTNLHMKILPHTHLHKILPRSHHTPLHPHRIIHMKLFTCRPFTCTRKRLSQHS